MHDNEQAFLMYRYKGNALVVLGDPIGDTQSFQTLLESFYQYAERLGYDVIFYQVSDRFMPLYHNFGNQFFKLGEEAIIDLTQFTISGKKRRGFRATLNKLEELEFKFEILEPPFSNNLMSSLKEISDMWLDGRQEMHFSVDNLRRNIYPKHRLALLKIKMIKSLLSVV